MIESLELPIEMSSHRFLSSKEIKAVKTAIEGKILKLNKLEWTGNLRLNVTWLALSKEQPTRHEMSEPLRWTWLRKVLKSIVPVLVCSCLSSNVLSLRLGNFHCLRHLILAAHNFGPNYFRKYSKHTADTTPHLTLFMTPTQVFDTFVIGTDNNRPFRTTLP